ncbi:MAG TPA: GntR family transcriptional regulator [Candidatus Krumholzibacteria bacterium]|jgi:GntR family transcriptional regulator|nr:GntR family transcriptional regulator [Candidatus Krumholzibacteria bacterium]
MKPLAMRIDPADPRPIYVQVMDELRRAIATGALAPGDPVPSIRDAARQLRINPLTVKQAYGELEREALVEVRRGLGTYVRANVSAEATREVVAHTVAERALRDAYRNGVSVRALLLAIRAIARSGDSQARSSGKRERR